MFKYSFRASLNLNLIFSSCPSLSCGGDKSTKQVFFFSTFEITSFTLVNSWILFFFLFFRSLSSAAWLTSAIFIYFSFLAGRSCQSSANAHALTSKLYSGWPQDNKQRTLMGADKPPLVSLYQLKCGGACRFCCLCLCVREREKRYQETDRKIGMEGGGGSLRVKEINRKKQRSGRQRFLTIACCHTNPSGKSTVLPKRNTRCVNSMGNTKHSPVSHSHASLNVKTS